MKPVSEYVVAVRLADLSDAAKLYDLQGYFMGDKVVRWVKRCEEAPTGWTTELRICVLRHSFVDALVYVALVLRVAAMKSTVEIGRLAMAAA